MFVFYLCLPHVYRYIHTHTKSGGAKGGVSVNHWFLVYWGSWECGIGLLVAGSRDAGARLGGVVGAVLEKLHIPGAIMERQ